MGNRVENLSMARKNIEAFAGKIIAESSIYETAAWGITDQDAFLNQVIEIETRLSPQNLIRTLLKIEANMGRRREIKWGPRLIDLDILYFSNKMIQEENLTIPHPFLQDRGFVLIPLAEIAPKFKHPILQKTNQELLNACNDTGEIRKF